MAKSFYEYLVLLEQDPMGGMGGPPGMGGGPPGMGGGPPGMGGPPGGGAPTKPIKIKFDNVWDVLESLLKGQDPDKESKKEAKKDLQSGGDAIQSPEQPPQPSPPPQPGMPPAGAAAPNAGMQHLQGIPGM